MFAIAAFGGILLEKAKMPLGLMVGAMLGVSIYNILTGNAHYSTTLKLMMQVLIGACIGCKIGIKQLLQLKKAVFPTIAVCVSTTVFTVLFGYLVFRFCLLGFRIRTLSLPFDYLPPRSLSGRERSGRRGAVTSLISAFPDDAFAVGT